MDKRFFALFALVLPLALGAQDFTKLDPTLDYGARFSAGVDYRFSKGLHFTAGEEVRLNSSNIFDKSYTTLGVDYKINDYMKTGADYSFILRKSTEGLIMRNRVDAYLTGSLAIGDFKISLREKVQATMKGQGSNTYQSPATALALKSRLKVSYSSYGSALTPYVSVELRHALNDVSTDGWTQKVDEDNGKTYWWITDPQYTFCYMNRVRGMLGTEWKLARAQDLDLYLVCDYGYSRQIDTNAAGRVKYTGGLTVQPSWSFAIGAAYTFSIKRR